MIQDTKDIRGAVLPRKEMFVCERSAQTRGGRLESGIPENCPAEQGAHTLFL